MKKAMAVFLTAAALMIPRSAYAQIGLFDVIQQSIEEGKRKKAEEEANKPRIRSFRLIAAVEKQNPKIKWQKEKRGDYEGMVPLTEANLKKMETVTRIDLSAVSDWEQGGEEGDLSVLRYFPNLKELNVSGCRVTKLGSAIMHLKQLEKLDCSGNELKELKIAGHPSLTEVNCRSNLFTALNFSNIETLKRLDCSQNRELTALNIGGLPALEELNCSLTGLKKLDAGNLPALVSLDCSGPPLSEPYRARLNELNVQGNLSLRELKCGGNEIASLNLSSLPALKKVDLSGNMAKESDSGYGTRIIDELNFNGDAQLEEVIWPKVFIRKVDLSGTSALKTVSCLTAELILADAPGVVELKCSGGKLETLDVGACTRLRVLDCGLNENLETLNLTGAAALEQIDCSSTKITSLDFDGLKNLIRLDCSHTYVMSLNLSEQKNLEELIADETYLKSLDLSGLARLKKVRACSRESMDSLTLSGNAALASLTCDYVKSLDLTPAPYLVEVECRPSELKVVGLSRLKVLRCQGNIKVLDLTGLTALEELSCPYNDLTKLDLTPAKRLKILNCSYGEFLTELIVGKSGALEELDCSNSFLNTLDVSGAENLRILNCSKNRLTSLVFGRNKKLERLDFSHNDSLEVTDARFIDGPLEWFYPGGKQVILNNRLRPKITQYWDKIKIEYVE